MGCDIHVRTEILQTVNSEKKWFNCDHYKLNKYYGVYDEENKFECVELYDGRNYNLFSTLANVRNYDNNQFICEPKGKPEDMSKETKEYVDLWDGDGHSYSYFTLKELKDAREKLSITKYSGYVSELGKSQIDNGEMPDMWCKGTNDKSMVYVEWERPNETLDYIIELLEIRLGEEVSSYRYRPKENQKFENEIRIIFFFDN